MNCHVCKRPFENGETVIQTVVKEKKVTVCDVKKSPGCAREIDKKRGQQEAFPAGLWTKKLFQLQQFSSPGAMAKDFNTSWNDGVVVKVPLYLPGTVSTDALKAFLGQTVTLKITKVDLLDIDKPKAVKKGDASKAPKPIPINTIVTNADDLKKLSKAEIAHVHQVCEISLQALVQKTKLDTAVAEDLYERCWEAHGAAQSAIAIDTLGFKLELVADLKAAGIETAQQVVELGTTKALREKTGLAQSRCPQVLKACKAAVDGAAAAQKRISKDNKKAKDKKTAA